MRTVRYCDCGQTRNKKAHIVLKKSGELESKNASMCNVITKKAEDKTTEDIGNTNRTKQKSSLIRTDWMASFQDVLIKKSTITNINNSKLTIVLDRIGGKISYVKVWNVITRHAKKIGNGQDYHGR